MSDELYAERVAGNEVAFRRVNESLRASTVAADHDQPHPFCCECGRIGCSELLQLRLAQYEQVRANPRQFFVVDGHQIDEVEEVVARHPGFLIVQKSGTAGAIAAAEDPRG
ncbi:hypothetical protein DSM112329_01941 [Paraconexibacter sp. AEG42_29]|uniref:Uncharacterized protein n=1 Tax=Paraconexibacter sp. AEG42_29 TaxID=2997339 RepID=A0AAU7ATU2_9ACTN